MTKPPYDIYLGNIGEMQGYKTSAFIRDAAPLIAPRFGSAANGQTDLDLSKIATMSDVEGGMFQQYWEDNKKALRVRGIYNPVNKRLHPTLPSQSTTGYTSYTGTQTATAEVSGFGTSFFATRDGSTNKIHRIDSAGVVTTLTLPAAISGSTCPITGLSLHKQYLFISGMDSTTVTFNLHRMDLAALSFQDLGGAFRHTRPLNGVLYGIQSESDFYVITNETIAGAATYTYVKRYGVGSSQISPVRDFVEYNGALYFSKAEGIYRYDGVDARLIIPIYGSLLTVFNGSMYFMSKNWLYEYSGQSLKKLQYFGLGSYIVSMSVIADWLAILSQPANTSYSFGGQDDDATYDSRIYIYDGAGITVFNERIALAGFPRGTSLSHAGDNLYVLSVSNVTWASSIAKYNFADVYKKALNSNQGPQVVTSEFDAGFPDVYKSFEGVDVGFDQYLNTETIKVEYALDGSSSYTTLRTLQSVGAGPLYENDKSFIEAKDIVFKTIKIRVTMNTPLNSYMTLGPVSISYTLQPRYRNRWQVTFPINGNDQTVIIDDGTGTSITRVANETTFALSELTAQKNKAYMLVPDYGRVKTAMNTTDNELKIKGHFLWHPTVESQDSILDYPLIAVKLASGDWYFQRVRQGYYDAGLDETVLYFGPRDYLGQTPAAIAAEAEVRQAFPVFVTRLIRDNLVIDDTTVNEAVTGESQYERSIVLEITEA
ncbi:hypothetical protein UFOVP667_13 [uncultured Caudovirales phage]|uniref:Uncharacterized protein n=1 Tax=uncultured Caudovirales phage TaxID=2100421 RepID=A0A6J5N9M3_9CAUD|nr:hypothetical protein UFOVP667_13 [uncultured Caudovirales phage]